MNRRRSPAALIAAALAASSADPIAQAQWTEVRNERFVVRGSFAPELLSQIACDVDAALRVVSITPRVAPSIIAVRGEKAVKELLPQYWERRGPRPVGAYWSGLYGHHIVVRADARRDERLRRMLHEIAHFATHLAHATPPQWLDEGLSEIWEHAVITSGQIEVGRPIAGHLRVLRSEKNWIPLADLMASTSLPDRHGSKASAFYAQSWALVHYLLFEKARGNLTLDRPPGPYAVPSDAELRAYVRGRLPAPVRIPLAIPESGCAGRMWARTVPDIESLILKARAIADGERPDAALPLIDEALRREPDSAAALETLGFVHFVANRAREAAAVFDRVIAERKGSHVAYYYRAVLASAVPAVTGGSGQVPELEYLREAIRLSPAFGPARDRLAELLKRRLVALDRLPVPH